MVCMADLRSAVLVYVLFINIVALVVYGWDKFCAVHGRWRVSELVLLLLAAVGGSVGAFVAMRFFHHKTRHVKFRLGVPVIFVLQVVGVCWVYVG